jgi:hypothetical protein
VVRRVRGCWPQMILLFSIMRCTPTIRELIVPTPLSLFSQLATGLSALAPAQRGHEKMYPRGKSQLSRSQHKPRVQALIEWSLDVVAGVHLSLLPVRRRERPCAEITLLLCGSAPLRAENSGPTSSRTCTTNRPAE